MRGVLILAGLMAASSAAQAAEAESESLEAAFLEYLADLEGDDDDWTLLAAASQKSGPQPESDISSESAKRSNPKKEAAKPAAEER